MRQTRRITPLRLKNAALFILICFGLVVPAISQARLPAASDLDYFKGTWVISVKTQPKLKVRWTVREEGSWIKGEVVTNFKTSSSDFWRIAGTHIERYAFTTDGLFVSIKSDGWQKDKIVFTGTASTKDGELKVRETITPETTGKFRALWERQGADGTWTIFSDETCTRVNR